MTAPAIETPLHLQDPRSCRKCIHSFYYKKDTTFERLACGKIQYQPSCAFARHETGDCGPGAKLWKERGV